MPNRNLFIVGISVADIPSAIDKRFFNKRNPASWAQEGWIEINGERY